MNTKVPAAAVTLVTTSLLLPPEAHALVNYWTAQTSNEGNFLPAECQPGSTNGATDNGREQLWLRGGFMVVLSLLAIFVLAALSTRFTQDTDRHAATKDLCSTLLPVIGTWIGTALAFYFSKESFAAARQTDALV